MISSAQPDLVGYRLGDREPYRKVMNSTVRPDFMFTKLMSSYPEEADEIGAYTIGNTEVTIFSLPESVQNLYHIILGLIIQWANLLDLRLGIQKQYLLPAGKVQGYFYNLLS